MNKFIFILRKRRYFKKANVFLTSGLYYISGDKFSLKRTYAGKKLFWNIVRIKSTKLNVGQKYSNGIYTLGKYKAKLFLKDIVVFILFSKKRYYQAKLSYQAFHDSLFYKTINYNFIDSKLTIFSELVIGNQYFDKNHFDLFIKIICEQYSPLRVKKRINVGKYKNIPFFVQHGDCKNSNIIWIHNNPIMIDLEAMGLYPIFYDLFYYIFITYKEKSPDLLKSIGPSISEIALNLTNEDISDPLDYYLSCYLIYLSEKYISNKYSQSVLEFYLGWITYSDYSFMPTLSKTIDDVMIKIKNIGYNI